MLLALLAAPAVARAQDAAVDDAAVSDVSTVPESSCVPDTLPADRAPRIEVSVGPEQPRVGDRVLITYRFRYRARDRVEFDPDVVAFQQPAIEMDYARDQPERDRNARPAGDGFVTTDVTVAVQPFKVADVLVASLPARITTGDEIARVCTPIVRFRVRSVFGNEAHPQPKDITAPAEVRFGALTLRYVALALDALFIVVVVTLGVVAWLRAKPKKVPPPPPPRHPYLVASEALAALARSDLLTRGHTKDYYDAISDVIRRYLGGMRNFDAIEMTSDEVLAQIRKNPLTGVTFVEIERLLSECDLVKFAGYVPSHEEADEILKAATSIVERGRPAVLPAEGATETRVGGAP
jgi:hypothetical protein